MRLLLNHHGFHAVFLAPDPTHGHPSHEERGLVRGQEYGVETGVVEKQTHSRLEHWITRLAQDSVGDNP